MASKKKDLNIPLLILCLELFLLFNAHVIGAVKGVGANPISFKVNGQEKAILSSNGLGIGVSPNHALHVAGNTLINGSLKLSHHPITISSNTTLDDAYSIVCVDTGSDNITLTLPYAGNVNGQILTIKKMKDANVLRVVTSDNLIDNMSEIELSGRNGPLPVVELFSNGENWVILDASGMQNGIAGSNLLLWYPLDETAGATAHDVSNNGHHGSLTGTSFSSNSSAGPIEQALGFDGSNDHISTSFSANLSALSMSMWYFQGTDTWDTIVEIDTGLFGFGPKGSGSSNRMNLKIGTPSGQYAENEFPYNTWHHLTITWDTSGQLRLYKNAQEVISQTGNNTGNTIPMGSIRLGDNMAGSKGFTGRIDDFRFFDRVLTEDEINVIYQSGTPPL